MQQAINIRHENVQMFSELYNVKSSREESPNRNSDMSSIIYGLDPQSLSSLKDWEFFCNELEYE